MKAKKAKFKKGTYKTEGKKVLTKGEYQTTRKDKKKSFDMEI
jgi:hypothetical protein